MPLPAISYRNDRGAPPGPDGLYHLGASEWEDLEAGTRHALRSGARRVILAGWSMGGAVIAEFLRRPALADSVAGVVLDAPVLDWSLVVDRGARREGGLAPALAPLAKLVVSARTGFRSQDSGDRLTLVRTKGAGQVQSWNRDPARYESALRRWLSSAALDSSRATPGAVGTSGPAGRPPRGPA